MLPRIGHHYALGVLLGLQCLGVHAQTIAPGSTPPSTWPNTAGTPNSTYGPDWQQYFRVPSLPYTSSIPSTFAGSMSVNRDGHPNNTLFFTAFERENGSLTANPNERQEEPWLIWLNGGPGSSSLYGLFSEHGPLRFELAPLNSGTPPDQLINITSGLHTLSFIVTSNSYSWHNQASIFYIDQPVGTGWSTAESDGYVADEDQMGRDFVGFLTNLVKVFPSLATRPLVLIGESYAGTYIPYITKTILNTSNPPVHLQTIAIGDGTLGNYGVYTEYSALQILQSYPQLINFNTTVYEYFVDQYNQCGYNLTLDYPSQTPYPTLRASGTVTTSKVGTYEDSDEYKARLNVDSRRQLNLLKRMGDLMARGGIEERDDHLLIEGRKFERRQFSKRQTINGTTIAPPIPVPPGTLHPFYQCWVVEEIWAWAQNYTMPWRGHSFDVYRIADALWPEAIDNPDAYVNIPAVQAALHAPQSAWIQSVQYPFNNSYDRSHGNPYGDPSPEPQTFMDDLKLGESVKAVFYSGNDDSLVGHRGTELSIQNTSFGGIRGFTSRPSTPFYADDGTFAGIVHSERNVTYALFLNAGHMVPRDQPAAAYAFLRDHILSSNTTPSSSSPSASPTAPPNLAKGILEGSYAYLGLYRTQSTSSWAQSYWDAWNSYFTTRTAADAPAPTMSGDGQTQGAQNVSGSGNGSQRTGVSLTALFSVTLGSLALL